MDAGIELLEVLATPDYMQRHATDGLLHRLRSATPVAETPAALLDELADADAPRGIVALATSTWGEDCGAVGTRGPLLFIDRIQDPGNLGAVARVAEAAGAAALCLAVGTVHPGHPRALRASAGSLLRLPVVLAVEASDLTRTLGEPPPPWIHLCPRGGENLYQTELPERLVLILGSEGSGASPDLEARAERSISIPMAPEVESLNVAVAAGVVLFELRRRQDGWQEISRAGVTSAAGESGQDAIHTSSPSSRDEDRILRQ